MLQVLFFLFTLDKISFYSFLLIIKINVINAKNKDLASIILEKAHTKKREEFVKLLKYEFNFS